MRVSGSEFLALFDLLEARALEIVELACSQWGRNRPRRYMLSITKVTLLEMALGYELVMTFPQLYLELSESWCDSRKLPTPGTYTPCQKAWDIINQGAVGRQTLRDTNARAVELTNNPLLVLAFGSQKLHKAVLRDAAEGRPSDASVRKPKLVGLPGATFHRSKSALTPRGGGYL